MDALIDILTYQSPEQKLVQIAASLVLMASAVMVTALMVQIPRKPWLDKALTLKQAFLALLGLRGAVALLFDRSPELWGTAIYIGLAIAAAGVMIETIIERRNTPETWDDPYAVIDELRAEVAELKTRLAAA